MSLDELAKLEQAATKTMSRVGKALDGAISFLCHLNNGGLLDHNLQPPAEHIRVQRMEELRDAVDAWKALAAARNALPALIKVARAASELVEYAICEYDNGGSGSCKPSAREDKRCATCNLKFALRELEEVKHG